ncbi:MAG: TrkA C-terminal domain-containing protein [Halorientalis sp.]
MASLPVEILFGVYLGVLTGIIPALVAWGLGFLFRYFTGVSIPGFGVVVLAVALAGVGAGLLALADPAITQSANAPTLVTGILVVVALALYAHNKGDHLGATFPRRLSLAKLRDQRLPRDVVELIGGRDEVRIGVTGSVADIEGYPPLPDDVRTAVRNAEYTLPADLTVAELETRVAERLRTEFELGDVAVSIDARGRASVAAAPPFSGLSKRVPAGQRAASVTALVPTGLARGDEVTLDTGEAVVDGTVLSARSGEGEDRADAAPATAEPTAAEPTVGETTAAHAPTTTGGEGRVTVAVSRSEADALVRADRADVTVRSRGTRREYELLSLLRRSGRRFRRLTVAAGGALDGTSIGAADVRGTYGVAVLAVRTASGWQLVPGGTVELAAGDDLFAVGPRDALDALEEAVA